MSANPSLENPFKGLRPFEQEDEKKLFGRERDLILFKERILSSRTTLLFAGSGVGKTSFLNAKVIPELEKRYCVIWHNRWTGAAEDTESWDDQPPLRIWPPLDFGKWVFEILFGAWRRRRLGLAQSKEMAKKTKEVVQEKIAVDVQEVISQSLKLGNEKRLSDVLSVFRKEAKGELADEIRKKGCMLILDQFEEVFQYHVYEDYFDDFIADLCKIINDDEYQVRVVFSMREEFLGELTAFDNRIPDLFNNYYRLRYPKTDEARRIITETCHLSSVEPHPENLVKLVEDLSSIEKNFDQSKSSDGGAVKTARVVRRDYVPPPYLQVVCDTLWKEQYETAATATNGGAGTQIKRFLEDYKSMPDPPVDGEESDAQRAVRQFCEAKLSLPFLRKWEQNIAARAFGFLVTKQGAKMAYELRSLAAHMEERAWALKHVLQKLSQPEARILRESRGPEGSYWFELYHDMYAGVVDRWKRRYTKEQRIRQRRQLLIIGAAVAALILVPLFVFHWIINPREYQQTIANYAQSLQTTDLNDEQYSEAFKAYSRLEDTLGYTGTAHSLWAKVWQRRAQLFEAKEKRDEAFLSLLQAAALTQNEDLKKNYIGQANNLLLGNEESIKHTFCTDCLIGAISRDTRYVVTIAQERIYTISNLADQPFHTNLCSDCSGRAVFSADGNSVAVTRPITATEKKADGNKVKVAEPSAVSGASTGGAQTPGAMGSAINAKDIVGWEVKIAPSEPNGSPAAMSFVIKKSAGTPATPRSSKRANVDSGAPEGVEFSLKALSKIENGFLVAGVLDQRLMIWRQDGSEFSEVVSQKQPANSKNQFSPATRFSPDGRFLAVSGSALEARLFEVTKTGLEPVGQISDLLKSTRTFQFSPSSKYLLLRGGESLTIYDLSSRKEVETLEVPSNGTQVIFAPDTDKFAVVSKGTVTVWNCETGKPAFEEPLKTDEDLWAAFVGKEARTFVLSTSEFTDAFEKYSLETGEKIAELDLGGLEISSAGSDGDLLLVRENSSTRLRQIQPLNANDKAPKAIEDGQTIESVSQNGSVILVTNANYYSTEAAKFEVKDVNQSKDLFSFVRTGNLYELSPDGTRVAISTTDNEVELFSAAETQTPPKLSFNTKVSGMTFSTDSRYLAVWTEDKQPHVLDLKTGAMSNMETADIRPLSWSFTPNSQYLVGSLRRSSINYAPSMNSSVEPGKPAVAIWSIATGKNVLLTLNGNEAVNAVAASNNRIAISQTNKMLIFDVATGNKIREFAYPGELAMLSLRADGKVVVTCDQRGVIQSWDTGEGKAGPTLNLGSAAYQMFIAADGATLVAVTSDHWAHQIETKDNTMRYASGIFTGEIDPRSIRPVGGDAITGLAWVASDLRRPQVISRNFQSSVGVLGTDDNAQQLLEKWKAKLNYEIWPAGFLSSGSGGASGSY